MSTADKTIFQPGEAAISLFIESAHERLNELRQSPNIEDDLPEATIDLDRPAVARTIAERVTDVLVSLGGRFQAGQRKSPVIAQADFDPDVRTELLELLPFEGIAGDRFCGLIVKDLKTFISSGGIIGGKWGKAAVRDDKIVFETTSLLAAPRARTREFIPSLDL